MDKIQIIFAILEVCGLILVIFGYLIKFKQKINLIAGVHKSEDQIVDKEKFASLVGGNTLLLGFILSAGGFGILFYPIYKNFIEPIMLLSILILGILTYFRAKKYVKS